MSVFPPSMRRPEIVKKDDAMRRLFIDDPKRAYIDRKLRGFDPMMRERPERLGIVREWLDEWENNVSDNAELV